MKLANRISWVVMASVGLAIGGAQASTNGAVTQLSGTLSVQKNDGSIRILSQRSEIQPGDTLSTQKESYAQIRFPDGAQITLKPNTSVKIDSFNFVESEPQKDGFLFNLVKGGLRAVTGLVGKRGNPDAYKLGTATATIGIRGTTFGADDCTTEGSCDNNLERAVFVSVSDGEIIATTNAGSASFLAGQFGMIDSRDRLPRFLSADPGLQFTPPASFIRSITGGTALNAGKNLECVVRR